MPKIRIKVLVKSHDNNLEFETDGMIQNNSLAYKEEDHTIVKWNYDKNSLIRENKAWKMEYVFIKGKETDGKVFIKDYRKEISIPIKTISIIKKNRNLEIHYQIENNNFIYRIEEII